MSIEKENIEQKTKKTLIGTSLLNEIFISFFGLMPFILRKDLLASTFQISLFTALKPAVAFLSFYWSSKLLMNKTCLRHNLIISGILARIPFLFFPLFDNVWYLIFASALFMLFSRAAIPPWMEILKLNLGKEKRENLFSLGSVLAYTEGVIIALLIANSLDSCQIAWKLFLFFSNVLGIFSIYLQYKNPINTTNIIKKGPSKGFLNPFKEGFELLKEKRDFAKFQIGSMASGFGLMLAMPALALFYADDLNLSHAELTLARFVFMGVGFVLLSPLWAKAMQKYNINFLLGLVCIGFALFPLFVLFGLFNKSWIYIAFLCYGITQAGSHLIWNLSGPTFAKEEDSSKYTSINVLAVGIRGLIAPFLGGLFCELFGPITVFIISMCMCALGTILMFSKRFFSAVLVK